MRLIFSPRAWDEYLHWQTAAPATHGRLNGLIRECTRTPFTGTGKPEPLRGNMKGWWSRRITLEDRLVYRVIGAGPEQALEIAQCRSHSRRRFHRQFLHRPNPIVVDGIASIAQSAHRLPTLFPVSS